MTKPKVLISDALSPAAVQIFKDRGVEVDFQPNLGKDKDKLAEIIGNYDGLAIRSATKVTEKLLEKATRLKVIGRAGIGVDNVDIPAASKKGVIVMNTPFGNSITTAEHAITLMLALAATTGMMSDLTVHRERLEAAASSGFSTATDLADWLVREAGLPFRDAHHATGALVARAEARGVDLPELTLEEMQAVNPAITSAVFDVLGVHNSVASRQSYGGTAPDQVRAQIARWKGVMEGWE